MAIGEETIVSDNPTPGELLLYADQRQVFNVGGDSNGITLDQDDVENGDQVFIMPTDDPHVKKLYLPGYID